MKKAICTTILILLLCPAAVGAKGVSLKVGDSAVEWRSAGAYSRDDYLSIRLRYKGRNLTASQVKADCIIDFTGYGLSARLWACEGDPAPLRLRVSNARGDTVKVRFLYWR